MSSLDLTFGVGNATTVDKIEIEWPSGVNQTLTGIDVNQLLDVEEPAS